MIYCCNHSFNKIVIFSPQTHVVWVQVTFAIQSGIFTTTWLFKLSICHLLTSVDRRLTLLIQNCLFLGKAIHTCSPLGVSLSCRGTLFSWTHFHAVTQKLADKILAIRISNHLDERLLIYFVTVFKSK